MPCKRRPGREPSQHGREQLRGVRRARGTGAGRGGAPTSTWSAGAEERPDGEDAQAVGEEGGEEARRRRSRHGHAARESGIMGRWKENDSCGWGVVLGRGGAAKLAAPPRRSSLSFFAGTFFLEVAFFFIVFLLKTYNSNYKFL